MKQMSLNGKLALVTGASRGIGRATALALANQGAFVIGTATSEAGADTISQYLKADEHSGMGCRLNVTEQESIDALWQTITSTFEQPVQIIVNNAAVTADNLTIRMKQSEWDNVIDTNLTGVFRLIRRFLKPLLKSRWGRIVNIGSVSGLMGNPGQINYSAAKAGLIGASKALANELASRAITVNVVAPGYVATDMTEQFDGEIRDQILAGIPVGRFAKPEEIAAAVQFLVSDEAGYITGETLNINGGKYMS